MRELVAPVVPAIDAVEKVVENIEEEIDHNETINDDPYTRTVYNLEQNSIPDIEDLLGLNIDELLRFALVTFIRKNACSFGQ